MTALRRDAADALADTTLRFTVCTAETATARSEDATDWLTKTRTEVDTETVETREWEADLEEEAATERRTLHSTVRCTRMNEQEHTKR